MDILGLWGTVATDIRNSDVEHIHSLAFITNECPSRSLLELESHLIDEDYYSVNGVVTRIDDNHTLLFIIIVTVSILISIFCCYLCLKNRGRLFKWRRNESASNIEVPGETARPVVATGVESARSDGEPHPNDPNVQV